MDGVLTLNNNINIDNSIMSKTKEKKKIVLNEIKNKLEQAKLNLIYTELEELNINIEKNYTSVDELKKDIKGKINELDYNKININIKKIDGQLEELVGELEQGSTNAFTNLMTSDLSKTIAKTLGITLAGRTALILAPTIGTKAMVAAGLSGYGLYRLIKNRKEIIKSNEVNELNNILMDLEVTKEEGKYTDTRFDSATQEEIRKFLKTIRVNFEDTGYRSLRSTIYSLDNEQKRALCNLLNIKLGKGINIEKRITSAKKN